MLSEDKGKQEPTSKPFDLQWHPDYKIFWDNHGTKVVGVTVLVRVSIVVTRNQYHGNSYKGTYLTGAGLQFRV